VESELVRDMLPRTKLGQTTPDPMFVGLNKGGFFLIDPRLKGDKAVGDHKCVSLSFSLCVWFWCLTAF
jgi:hypothetical protein